jgi:hypothetical protein
MIRMPPARPDLEPQVRHFVENFGLELTGITDELHGWAVIRGRGFVDDRAVARWVIIDPLVERLNQIARDNRRATVSVSLGLCRGSEIGRPVAFVTAVEHRDARPIYSRPPRPLRIAQIMASVSASVCVIVGLAACDVAERPTLSPMPSAAFSAENLRLEWEKIIRDRDADWSARYGSNPWKTGDQP